MAISPSPCFFPGTTPVSVGFRRCSVTCFAGAATAERKTATSSSSHIVSASPASSLYDILGIQMGADVREIKAAYRKLARVLHPDVASDLSASDDFIRIHAAYATLSDPGKRADYDRTLFRRQRLTAATVRTPSSVGTRFSGYTGRSWETDQCW